MEDAEGDAEKATVDTQWITRVSGAGLCGVGSITLSGGKGSAC